MIHTIPLIIFLCFSASTFFAADPGDTKDGGRSVLAARSKTAGRTIVRAASAKKVYTDADRKNADFLNRRIVANFNADYTSNPDEAIKKFAQEVAALKPKAMITRYNQCESPSEKKELRDAFFRLIDISAGNSSLASFPARKDLVSFLVRRRGVPIDVIPRGGQPALMVTCHTGILEHLLKLGANPNLTTQGAMCPLLKECRSSGTCATTAVQLLIFAGADRAWSISVDKEDHPFEDVPLEKRKSLNLHEAYDWINEHCRDRSLLRIYKHFFNDAHAQARVLDMLVARAAVRWDALATLETIAPDRVKDPAFFVTPNVYNHLHSFLLGHSSLSKDLAKLIAEYAVPRKKPALAPMVIESSDSKVNAAQDVNLSDDADSESAGTDAE